MHVWFKHQKLLTIEPNKKAISHVRSRFTRGLKLWTLVLIRNRNIIFMPWALKKNSFYIESRRLHKFNVGKIIYCLQTEKKEEVIACRGYTVNFVFSLTETDWPWAPNPARQNKIVWKQMLFAEPEMQTEASKCSWISKHKVKIDSKSNFQHWW